VNFCILKGKSGTKAIFINYLATTKETISNTFFSQPFLDFESSSGGEWTNRHVATFLLHILRMAMIAQGYDKGKFTVDICPLILQFCLEKSHEYYSKIGFTDHEAGNVEAVSDLLEHLPDYGQIILYFNHSKTKNYCGFCFNKDLYVMVHTTGDVEMTKDNTKFPRYNVSNAFFPLCAKEKNNNNWILFFHFHILKENLMILVADLEIFYLPFTSPSENLYNFLVPNSNYSQHQFVMVDYESRKSLLSVKHKKKRGQKKAEETPGWIEEGIIKLMIQQ